MKHASGGTSSVSFKSYQEGRESFQGSAIEVLWFDEEPDSTLYTEGLMRTMTTGGICYLTFTPLQGLSTVVLSFLPNGVPG